MKHKKNIICCNCGKRGHINRFCKFPKTSLGIIAYHIESNINKYLLICRKQSHGYVELFRGKYKLNDIDFLKRIINEMTNTEKYNLLNKSFEYLWTHLWYSSTNKNKKDFIQTKKKFLKLKKGYFVNNKYIILKDLINESVTNWIEPEWGFPKGKRKIKESDINCAMREFNEETGLDNSQYKLLLHFFPMIEEFVGSNNVQYKHIYYIAQLLIKNYTFIIDKNNNEQYHEISKIGCYTYEDCMKLIRPYNIEKKNILRSIHTQLQIKKKINTI